ncbi:hypothetical protein BD289DRAFT_244223 [Coniella lustricola]|uniref:Ecp2 effector protein-like domain-containing protein n=1 Tax=Coniella lustricola TaxID=2025994 RepID=A0A2T3A995_9PEZI|nr:hypothetical protein BD289DRAFT_244223 [Coniella lustricola]
MRTAALIGLALCGLASLASTTPVSILPIHEAKKSLLFLHETLNIRNINQTIAHVAWHAASPESGLGDSNQHHNTHHHHGNKIGNGGKPSADGNVTVCGNFVYDDVSPSRTTIYREDCYALLTELQASPGFWSLWKWRKGDTAWRGLASSGSCEVAVQRLGGSANETLSRTVLIGNQDVVNILNASVFDLAAAADEPFVDNMRSQGHMDCRYSRAANASMEFRIQLTEEQE